MEYEAPVHLPPDPEPSLYVKLYEFFLTPDGHAVGMLILLATFVAGIALIYNPH